MSLPILTPADFIGPFAIPQTQFDSAALEQYITIYEEKYLRKLLTDQAYVDIRDAALTPKYTDLINGTEWTDDDGDLRVNDGLKEILKRFIYYHFGADNWQNTPAGKAQNLNENSRRLPDVANMQVIYQRYNDGITRYQHDIVPFVLQFDLMREDITGFVDNGGGSYTINTAATQYLEDADEVTISNTKYTVSNIVIDTSFDITASGPGLSFSGEYQHEPYKDFNLPILKRAWL